MPLKFEEVFGSDIPEIIFSYIKNGNVFCIAIERLVKHCKENNFEIVEIEIEPEYAQILINNKTVDQKYMNSLTLEKLDEPCTYIKYEEKTYLLVDGNHRYVRCWQLGLKTVKSYYVPTEVWKEFEIIMPKFFPELKKFDKDFKEMTGEWCAHIGIVSINETQSQCMDCLRIWNKGPDFKSDWPQFNRG
jgi:REP element-mobilizing transposase RayT